eukprot:CAMPEP_0174239028 /NCGR_PEP_ID=MMETSP0417-20130205/13224_1 /TAXON_ID=242541 /ORGANISM="Mayorella sp, Strain BSH-02190019" /LENGTH=217 /DNA_ID=CAMNT_0015317927 /DNA_START=28 /DNA_END=681 /DNA_ORIENTATION=+
MSLQYGAVASGLNKLVLAEHNVGGSSNGMIARGVLDRLDPIPQQKVYAFQQLKVYATYTEEGLVYIAIADEAYQTRGAIYLLRDLESMFLASFGETWREAADTELSFQETFSRTIDQKLKFWNDPRNDKFHEAKEKIKNTKQVLVEDIDHLIARGEKVEDMVERTALLETQAKTYKKEAKKTKAKMWCKQRKMCICGTIIAVVVVGALVAIIIGVAG